MISEPPKKTQKIRMLIITLVVLGLAGFGFIILSQERFKAQIKQTVLPEEEAITENQDDAPVVLPTTVVVDRTRPWVELRQTGGEGDTVIVKVFASTGDKDITGYDILLGKDPAEYEIVSVTTDLPNFIIKDFDRGSYHAVTGIKDLQSKEPTLLADTAILTVTLKRKVQGQGVLTILPNQGPEKTQFVDVTITVIEPQVGSVTFQ